jgi:putative endonuclease
MGVGQTGQARCAKDAVGAYGERVAARHLEEVGMRVLDRNWRCAEGELDLVALDGDVLVFCEVKTRSGAGFGAPAEAVVRSKASRIRGLALRWIADHPGHGGQIRFDVVGVMLPRSGAADVTHIPAAF